MLAQEFALQEIIFRTLATQRFSEKPNDQHRAINAVTAPGELRAGRIEGHHHPNAKPKERPHDRDLAEQKNAIQSLRALGDHGYRLGIKTAVGTAAMSIRRLPE